MSRLSIITGMTAKKHKMYIEIDGEHHLFLYTKELNKSPFKELIQMDQALTEEDVDYLNQHVVQRGKRRVMYLLGSQDYPKQQLVEKLLKDGYVQIQIEQILHIFEEKGYIDDQRLTQQRIQHLKQTKSKREIEYVLKQQGLNPTGMKELIRTEITDEDEIVTATNLLIKKFSLKKHSLDEKILKNKILGFLGRKGFSSRTCFEAYKHFFQEEVDHFEDIEITEIVENEYLE